MSANEKKQEMLKKIDFAISSLRRGKKKLSISAIAEKAKIARKTIYNNSELKERCDQAIYIQEEQIRALSKVAIGSAAVKTDVKPLTGRKLLEERYRKSREEIKLEREKGAKLLENNRKLVLEKAELKNRIEILQNQIEKLREKKIKRFEVNN